MFIKRKSRTGGFSLVEMMMALGIFSLVGGAVAMAYVFSLRSFQALSNYAQLDQQNRMAMDMITREIREANSIVSYKNGNNAQISLVDGNGGNITYSFSKAGKTMSRTSNGVAQVLLQNCSLINFNLGMRPPATNYGYYSTTNVNLAKMVDLTWRTSMVLPNSVTNSENIQTARIVVRKQKMSGL